MSTPCSFPSIWIHDRNHGETVNHRWYFWSYHSLRISCNSQHSFPAHTKSALQIHETWSPDVDEHKMIWGSGRLAVGLGIENLRSTNGYEVFRTNRNHVQNHLYICILYNISIYYAVIYTIIHMLQVSIHASSCIGPLASTAWDFDSRGASTAQRTFCVCVFDLHVARVAKTGRVVVCKKNWGWE